MKDHNLKWPKTLIKPRYYNAGVMLFSKDHLTNFFQRFLSTTLLRFLTSTCSSKVTSTTSYSNTESLINRYHATLIDWKPLGGKQPVFQSFIHYAIQLGFQGQPVPRPAIQTDYKSLFPDEISQHHD